VSSLRNEGRNKAETGGNCKRRDRAVRGAASDPEHVAITARGAQGFSLVNTARHGAGHAIGGDHPQP